MMRLSEAAFALGVEHRGDDVTFTRVCTDSRAVMAGDLFVALRGERFDGHAYCAAAQSLGAVAALVDGMGVALAPAAMPLIAVNDTLKGLGQLAHAWRSRFDLPLVALTGSSGKTTVKEMLAAILDVVTPGAVLATRGNLNNEIGVPLMLLELNASHRCAVIEMGMNHAGEISRLTRVARPDVALVNNAGHAHVGNLGSVEAVAHAKGEIFEGLARNGTAVINADDAYAALWHKLSSKNNLLTFGLECKADVTARYTLGASGSEIEFQTVVGSAKATLAAPGVHNVRNALAACASALAMDVALADIAQGLANYHGVKGRLQYKAGLGGAVIIDDTYNANPESVRAAIDVLARLPGERHLVLGDMGELGDESAACHREAGAHARTAGINGLSVLGEASQEAAAAFGSGARHFETPELLVEHLKPRLISGVTVLVKGSRFMRMERVVSALLAVGGVQ
jgi:UDP-N-acetylmuramoyl-tripeptide--D-alanyl-D-alanine ligase